MVNACNTINIDFTTRIFRLGCAAPISIITTPFAHDESFFVAIFINAPAAFVVRDDPRRDEALGSPPGQAWPRLSMSTLARVPSSLLHHPVKRLGEGVFRCLPCDRGAAAPSTPRTTGWLLSMP